MTGDLTPREQELLQALAQNQAWHSILDKMEAVQIKVLKANTQIEQLCRAQGATQTLDFFRGRKG